MARRTSERLTPLFVARAKAGKVEKGKYPDGKNLYLIVEESGSARWVHRYLGADGKDHWHGLGSVQDFTLEEARERNAVARKLRIKDGLDPIEVKKAEKVKRKLDAAKSMTLRQCGQGYIAAHSPS